MCKKCLTRYIRNVAFNCEHFFFYFRERASAGEHRQVESVAPRRLDKGSKRAGANFPIEKRQKAAAVQDASRFTEGAGEYEYRLGIGGLARGAALSLSVNRGTGGATTAGEIRKSVRDSSASLPPLSDFGVAGRMTKKGAARA
jgi:hypothetical protein